MEYDKRNRVRMEMNTLSLIFTCLLGAYIFVFGFLKKANEWFYLKRLGRKQYDLPPGDMGWPLVGKMPSYKKSLKSGDPDSFVSSFISRSFPFCSFHVFRVFLVFCEVNSNSILQELYTRFLIWSFMMEFADMVRQGFTGPWCMACQAS